MSTESLEKRIANLEAMVTDLWKERKQVWDSEKERDLLVKVRYKFQHRLVDRIGSYAFFEPIAYKEATNRVINAGKIDKNLYLEILKDLEILLKPLKEEGHLIFNNSIELEVAKDFIDVVKDSINSETIY